jgi:hypothetical protein
MSRESEESEEIEEIEEIEEKDASGIWPPGSRLFC